MLTGSRNINVHRSSTLDVKNSQLIQLITRRKPNYTDEHYSAGRDKQGGNIKTSNGAMRDELAEDRNICIESG